MTEEISQVSLSVEKREEEIYTPPKQSANTLFRFFKSQNICLSLLRKGRCFQDTMGKILNIWT